MKMMLRILSLFLLASFSAIILFGCQQEDDLFIYLHNKSNIDLNYCIAPNYYFCREILSEEKYETYYATKNKADDYFISWIEHRVIKMCGKEVPLNKLILPPMKRKDGDKTIYHLIIPQEYYDRECGAGLTSQPSI